MDISTRRKLEQIIGYGTSNVQGERTFPVINGVVYTDLFDSTTNVPSGARVRFNSLQGTTYFNELVIDTPKKELTLNLTWGSSQFDTDVSDLGDYLDGFDVDDAGVRSKRIEDFHITRLDGKEAIADIMNHIHLKWGWLIRQPLIIDVAKEVKNDWLYF